MCDPSQPSPDSAVAVVRPPAANATAMRLGVVIAECTAMCEAEWWLDTVWFETVEHCLARTCIDGLQAPNSQADPNASPEDAAHLQGTSNAPPAAAVDASPVASTTVTIDESAWNVSLPPRTASESESESESAPPVVEATTTVATTATTKAVMSERERKKLARQRHHNQAATTTAVTTAAAAATTQVPHQKMTSPPVTNAVEPPAPVADADTAESQQVVAPKSHGATTDGVGRMVKKKGMG